VQPVRSRESSRRRYQVIEDSSCPGVVPRLEYQCVRQRPRRSRCRDVKPALSAYSTLSFGFASVCHFILLGSSAPLRLSFLTWSITTPGQAPERLPVAGLRGVRMNAARAAGLRLMRPRLSRWRPHSAPMGSDWTNTSGLWFRMFQGDGHDLRRHAADALEFL
jgi:hypothetical protein